MDTLTGLIVTLETFICVIKIVKKKDSKIQRFKDLKDF